jgi:hypothetical protein
MMEKNHKNQPPSLKENKNKKINKNLPRKHLKNKRNQKTKTQKKHKNRKKEINQKKDKMTSLKFHQLCRHHLPQRIFLNM